MSRSASGPCWKCGSTSSTTWYWLSWVKMVDTCRCPNASYRVSSTAWGRIPRRLPVSRSMTSMACSPRLCWSLATSRSSGRVLSFSTSWGANVASSVALASSSVYWNWVRLTRFSTRQVLHGLHVEGHPLHLLEPRLQAADDLRRGGAPLVARLEGDLDASAGGRRVGAVDPDERRE